MRASYVFVFILFILLKEGEMMVWFISGYNTLKVEKQRGGYFFDIHCIYSHLNPITHWHTELELWFGQTIDDEENTWVMV